MEKFVIENKKILAVVPARGGSKGVKLKNLREVGGLPLVGIVGDLLSSMPEIDRAVVSTDHEKIAECAKKHSLDVPFMRPEFLSGDRIGDLEVLTHALTECERIDGVQYDIVLMLQPTSPFRTREHIMATLEKMIDGNFDSVWTLSPTDPKAHPLKQLTMTGDVMEYFDKAGAKIIARQQLKTLYHRNGVAYAISRSCLLDQKSIKGKNSSAVIIEETMVNIDSEEDITYAEFLLSRGKNN